MLHQIDGATIHVSNFVNYKCHPQEYGNDAYYDLIKILKVRVLFI